MPAGRSRISWLAVATSLALVCAAGAASGDDPKPTPENTISIKLAEPVKPQTFARPIRFYVENIIDRSGNPQPMLVYKGRGGVFLDRQPVAIVQEALAESLRTGGLLAADREAANYLLTVYVFHFGLAAGSGFEYYGKVDLNVVVKDRATGKSQTVTALGTSIEGTAVRKKNIMKNVEENIELALGDALRNLLRGTKLRDAVTPAEPAPGTGNQGALATGSWLSWCFIS
jgi:hypothetical protein